MSDKIYPWIDPVILRIGFLEIRWYSIAYILGFLGCFYVVKWLNKERKIIPENLMDPLLTYGVLGTIIGGRLGYVLFYNPIFYLAHPLEIPAIWHGGMSFHGGFCGVVIALFIYTSRFGIKKLEFADMIATGTPIGLFFGRIANFINGELWGRPTDSYFGVIFPTSGDLLLRHPSQLYEAFLEGFLLFCILFYLAAKSNLLTKYRGFICGYFLLHYGISRIIIEFFREPDEQIGLIGNIVTMGQILSLPLVLCGVFLIYRSRFSR